MTVDNAKKPTAPSRNDGLDVIRATAALLVFATHLYHGYGMTAFGPLAGGGFSGVYMFFALSGYLLSRPFVEGPVDLRRYAIARVARLAPAYYLALAGVVLLGLAPGIVETPWPTLLVATNLVDLPVLNPIGQAWTLGVEIAFYAVLPLVAWVTAKRPWLLLGLTGASYILWTVSKDPWAHHQLPVLFWGFGFGIIVARWQDRITPRVWPLGLALLVYGLTQSSVDDWRHDATALGTALLIVAAARYRPRIPFARWPAKLSYGIYLWHVAVMFAAAGLGLPSWAFAITALAGTVAVALASFVLVERPVLRWSRKLLVPHDHSGLARRVLAPLGMD